MDVSSNLIKRNLFSIVKTTPLPLMFIRKFIPFWGMSLKLWKTIIVLIEIVIDFVV